MIQVSPQSDGGVCAAGQQTGAGPPQERGAGPGDWVEERGGPEHHRAPPPHLPADKPAELQEARSLRESPKVAFTTNANIYKQNSVQPLTVFLTS